MLTGMELMSCPNLAVPAEVMQHIVHVESSANPFAIGVVGGQLARQPQNLAEALATVKMLDDKGYNYSLGIAQVNRANFNRYGLDSYTKAFDTCANLSAGAHILADCYARAKGDWGNAFSCYYSGNFSTGYHDGYVQKVYASIGRKAEDSDPSAPGIPLLPASPEQQRVAKALPLPASPAKSSAHDRAALRSLAIDTAAQALVTGVLARTSPVTPPSHVSESEAVEDRAAEKGPAAPEAMAAATSSKPAEAGRAEPVAFIPRVRGPGETADSRSIPDTPSTTIPVNATASITADPENLSAGHHDAAFVF